MLLVPRVSQTDGRIACPCVFARNLGAIVIETIAPFLWRNCRHIRPIGAIQPNASPKHVESRFERNPARYATTRPERHGIGRQVPSGDKAPPHARHVKSTRRSRWAKTSDEVWRRVHGAVYERRRPPWRIIYRARRRRRRMCRQLGIWRRHGTDLKRCKRRRSIWQRF